MNENIASACNSDNQCCGAAPNNQLTPDLEAKGKSYLINGLCCAEEVNTLTRLISPEIGGSEYLAFDVVNARMTLLEGAKHISDKDLFKLIDSTGMSGEIWNQKSSEVEQKKTLLRQSWFTGISFLFWFAGLGFHIVESGSYGLLTIFSGHGDTRMPTIEIGAFLLAVSFGVWLVAPKAFYALRRLSPDMNLLMMIAVGGAIILGEYFEAATVSLFFALSLTLESWSIGRARNAVSTLLDLAPDIVRVIGKNGTEKATEAEKVARGDNFIIRAGDRIPLDGEVVSGAGAVDQSPITGESARIPKEPGDIVYAGTINGEGTLKIRATKKASDTVLAKITRMVGDAHSRRADVEQWVTKFARIYTPVILFLAILLAIIPPVIALGSWNEWFYKSLVLLVIACPCALVISTPVSIVAALASAARQGVLIKGGAYVEIVGRMDALAMDKTGTITSGKPKVSKIHALSTSEAEIIKIATALEAHSAHPLADAITALTETIEPADETKTIPGKGIKGFLEGEHVWLGSPRFASENGADIPPEILSKIDNSGNTIIAVGRAGILLGLLEVSDTIREHAKDTIDHLHQLGIKKIVMLTGDNLATAQNVADTVGIDEVKAQLLPEDKVEQIEELTAKFQTTAMIGDGINDAPAMARADFAIAMGAAGSDTAIETADIALMSDEISKLPWLIRHSRRTLSIIRQNIIFALVTKALFVGLTAMGLASMWGAIAADVGVSLAVITNALRLLKAK